MSNVYGWYVYIEASVSYPSDTTARVSWWSGFGSANGWRYELNNKLEYRINGTYGSRYTHISCAAHSRFQMASGTFDVARTSYDQQIGFSAWMDRSWDTFRPGTSEAATYVTVAAYPYVTPNPPSNASAKRVDDSHALVTWTNGAVTSDRNSRDRVEVWRWVDRPVQHDAASDPTWEFVARLGADATSYTDSGLSPNHRYQYGIYSYNNAGWAGGVSNQIVTSPAKPVSLSLRRNENNAVDVRVDNSDNITGSVVKFRYSVDGKRTWTDAASVQASGNGPVTTSIAAAGMVWVEAANALSASGGELVSPWTVSDEAVMTIMPPLSPTLISPAMSAIIDSATTGYVFTWVHNPIDGSVQTAAQLQYSLNDGGSWTTLDVKGPGQSKAITAHYNDNTKIVWRVRTKGAHDEFGPWSTTGVFRVYSAPTVTFISPTSTIEDMPVLVKWRFTSETGAQAAATVTASCGGRTRTYSVTSAQQIAIDASDGILQDGEKLSIAVNATCTTTLKASAAIEQGIEFASPVPPLAAVQTADSEASVSIVAYPGTEKPDNGRTYTDAKAFSIVRIDPDGSMHPVADGLAAYGAVVDNVAPLDTEVTYRVYAQAANGAASYSDFKATVPSGGCAFVSFGGKVAKLRYGVEHDEQSEPNVHLFAPAGGTRPRAFHGTLNTHDASLTGTVFNDEWDAMREYDPHDPEELESAWRELQEWRGNIVVRLPYTSGRTVKAAKKKLDISFAGGAEWWRPTVDLEYTEVE